VVPGCRLATHHSGSGPAQLYLVTEEVLSPAQYSLIALGDVVETIIDDPDDPLQHDDEPGEDEEDM